MNNINIGTEINLQDLLQSRLLIQANSGGGKSVLARVIIEESFGKVPFIVMDIEGEYYTLKELYGDVLIIGGQHADIPISMKSVKLLPKEIIANRLSVVIDLSDLQMSDRIMYAKYFFETMMDLPKEYWISYLVFVEEAHKLCGEQDKQASATAVKDLMSRGRKRGYCGVLLTQRISKLHKDAAAECNNKFIGRTFLDIDLDRSAKELGLSTAADKNIIRNLAPGNFYAFGTSIEPHQVHEVKVNLPKTKIPKAGVSLDIKPQKPTGKIKSMLAKLNDLPAAAEKEMKTLQQLQAEVNRLNSELIKATKSGNSSLSVKDANQIEKLKIDNQLLVTQTREKDQHISSLTKNLKIYDGLVKNIMRIIEKEAPAIFIQDFSTNIVKKSEGKLSTFPGKNFVDHNQKFSDKVYGMVANNKSPGLSNASGSLGKCAYAILEFLASFPDRSWTKAQVGIATSYSPNSGGFNNSKSELSTKGLINVSNGKLQVNSEADLSQWNFQPQTYSIETFKDKLGKCESEIYQVLLDYPNDSFSKEELAGKTASHYSFNSGGFNNSISKLATLELIARERGTIQLNPELLEI